MMMISGKYVLFLEPEWIRVWTPAASRNSGSRSPVEESRCDSGDPCWCDRTASIVASSHHTPCHKMVDTFTISPISSSPFSYLSLYRRKTHFRSYDPDLKGGFLSPFYCRFYIRLFVPSLYCSFMKLEVHNQLGKNGCGQFWAFDVSPEWRLFNGWWVVCFTAKTSSSFFNAGECHKFVKIEGATLKENISLSSHLI